MEDKKSIRMSLAYYLRWWRLVIPLIVMVGVVPHLYIIWLVWTVLTVIFCMPERMTVMMNNALFEKYQQMVLFFYEQYNGVEVVLYGDAVSLFKKPERVLYMGNHQSTVDWVVVEMLAARQGALRFCRYVMKNTIQAVPIFGHLLYEHGCIYVKKGQFNQEKMVHGLDRLKNPLLPSWLVIFPESTRFDPNRRELLQKCQNYAKERGLKVLEYHYTPRSLGMHLVLQRLRDQFDAVYDVTAIYENTIDPATGKRLYAPQMGGFMLGTTPRLHLHVNRIDIANVPDSQDELQLWLQEIFERKDRMLADYYVDCRLSLDQFAAGGLLHSHPGKTDQSPNVIPEPGSTKMLSRGQVHRLGWRSTGLHTLGWFTMLALTLMTEWGRSNYLNMWIFTSVMGWTWLWLKKVS